MSISENDNMFGKGFWIALIIVVGSIVAIVWMESINNKEIDERQAKRKADIWKNYYVPFMSDCQKAQRLKTCCLNDFKNTYLHAYENTPEFCKSSEVRKAESEARHGSSGQSLGDSVKQGVGVGIGLKVINSIL